MFDSIIIPASNHVYSYVHNLFPSSTDILYFIQYTNPASHFITYKAMAARIAAPAMKLPTFSLEAALVASTGADVVAVAASETELAAELAALDMDEAMDEAMEVAEEAAELAALETDEAADVAAEEAADDPPEDPPAATRAQIWEVMLWVFNASSEEQPEITQGVASRVMAALASPHWHALSSTPQPELPMAVAKQV